VTRSKYDPYRDIIVSGEIPSKKIAELIGNGCTSSAVRAARRRFLKPDEYKRVNAQWRKKNRTYENDVSRKARAETCKFATNNKVDYTEHENHLILHSTHTTQELAKQLGRSVDAIYQHQCRLRKKPQK